jgi:hypothetical protein
MTNNRTSWVLGPLGLVLLSGSVAAQNSTIERCKQTSSESERIACLEAALLGKEPPSATQGIAATPVEAEEQIDPPSMKLDAGPADDSLESAKTSPTGIGAEQVIANKRAKGKKKEARREVQGMVIAKYEWVPYERMVVTFENGQVWRQIKGDTKRIRTSLERNQTADITESGFGGYMLRLNEIRRTIRVERIR